jgi:hypothetical protein
MAQFQVQNNSHLFWMTKNSLPEKSFTQHNFCSSRLNNPTGFWIYGDTILPMFPLYPSESVFELTRVNLSAAIKDPENHKEKPYRYILKSYLNPSFPNKTMIAEYLLNKSKINDIEKKEILSAPNKKFS